MDGEWNGIERQLQHRIFGCEITVMCIIEDDYAGNEVKMENQ